MLDTAIRSVDREHLGLGRSFRQRMADASIAATKRMQRLAGAAVADFDRRRRPLRPDNLITLERQWREITPIGRLSLDLTRTKCTMHVAEIRVTATTLGRADFDEHEAAVAICRTALTLGEKSASWSTKPLAGLSLHAVARRIARSAPDDRTDDLIVRDLRTLATASAALLAGRPAFDPKTHDAEAVPEDIRIPTAFGQWRGSMSPMLTVHDGLTHWTVQARTFYDTDMRL